MRAKDYLSAVLLRRSALIAVFQIALLMAWCSDDAPAKEYVIEQVKGVAYNRLLERDIVIKIIFTFRMNKFWQISFR